MKPYRTSNPAIFSNGAAYPFMCQPHWNSSCFWNTPSKLLGAFALAVPSPCPQFHMAGTLLSFRSLYWRPPCWQSKKESLITPYFPSYILVFFIVLITNWHKIYSWPSISTYFTSADMESWLQGTWESLVSREGPGTMTADVYIYSFMCLVSICLYNKVSSLKIGILSVFFTYPPHV